MSAPDPDPAAEQAKMALALLLDAAKRRAARAGADLLKRIAARLDARAGGG